MIIISMLIFLILIKIFSELFIVIDYKYNDKSNSDKLSLSIKKFPIVVFDFLKNDINIIFQEDTNTIIKKILNVNMNQISYFDSYKEITEINNSIIRDCAKLLLSDKDLKSSFDTFSFGSKILLKKTPIEYKKINSIIDIIHTHSEEKETKKEAKEKILYNYF